MDAGGGQLRLRSRPGRQIRDYVVSIPGSRNPERVAQNHAATVEEAAGEELEIGAVTGPDFPRYCATSRVGVARGRATEARN